MTKQSEASGDVLNVVDANGKEHKVTRRAFEIIYKARGYKLATDIKPAKEKKKATEKVGG